MRATPIAVLSSFALCPLPSALAQALTDAEQIRLARSAAPAEVSARATVLVLRDGKYVEGVKGTNRVTCYVSRSQPEAVEPECFDAEAVQTVMPIDILQTELRLAGKSSAEVDRVVAEKIQSGEFRLPRRPAMVYMMSAAQILYTPDGRRVGAWKPHLMLYYPFVRATDLGLEKPGPLISFLGEGGATSAIVIPAGDFVQPAPAAP
jgi:hypothetical protein